MSGHSADYASVSGRDQPRPRPVTHHVRVTAALRTGRDSSVAATVKPVLAFSCTCGDWAPELGGSYSWPDIRDRVIIPHETGEAPS